MAIDPDVMERYKPEWKNKLQKLNAEQRLVNLKSEEILIKFCCDGIVRESMHSYGGPSYESLLS